jgi:hypothetical protein
LILTPIKRVPPYIEIAANSNYRGFNVESPFDPSYATIKSIKFVSAKFTIDYKTNKPADRNSNLNLILILVAKKSLTTFRISEGGSFRL